LIAHQVGIFPEVGILGIQVELTVDVPECSSIQLLSLLCSEWFLLCGCCLTHQCIISF